MKDRYIKKITLYNIIHMFFSLVFFVSVLLFLSCFLSEDFFIDKKLNLILVVLSGVAMGAIKIKVTHLKYQRYHHLADNENIPDFEEE